MYRNQQLYNTATELAFIGIVLLFSSLYEIHSSEVELSGKYSMRQICYGMLTITTQPQLHNYYLHTLW